MSRKTPGFYVDHTMIKLYRGDEKTLVFPVRKNWLYQLALEVSYVNTRTKKVLHFGKSIGSGARSNYCFSIRMKSFNYKEMKEDAIITGYNYCAGDQYDIVGTDEFSEDQWVDWKLKKIHAVYLIIWRQLKESAGIKVPKSSSRPVVLKTKTKKKVSEKVLEKKYPTPKKYLKAQKALKRKIAEQEKRQKTRAFKRKKSK